MDTESFEKKKVREWYNNARVMAMDVCPLKAGKAPSESTLDLLETLVEAQKEVFLASVEHPSAIYGPAIVTPVDEEDHQQVSLYIDSAGNPLTTTNIADTANDSFKVAIPDEFAEVIYESLRKFIESKEPQRERYVITTEQLIKFLRDYLMEMNTALTELSPDWLFLYDGEPWYQLKSARSNLPGEQLEVVSAANFLKAQISDGK